MSELNLTVDCLCLFADSHGCLAVCTFMYTLPDVTFYPSNESLYRRCKRRYPDNPFPFHYHCLWPTMAATTTSTSAVVLSPNRHNHNELDPDPDPVREFWCLLDENENIALSVAAMTVLTGVIRRSSASTVMGMEREIRWVGLGLRLGLLGLGGLCVYRG